MLGTAILIKRNAISEETNKILVDEEKKNEKHFVLHEDGVGLRNADRWYPTEKEMYSETVIGIAKTLMEDKTMMDKVKSIPDLSWQVWKPNEPFSYEVQYTRYKSNGLDAYMWHFDHGNGQRRVLNYILYLTDDFDGGETDLSADLALNYDNGITAHKINYTIKPERNMLLMFPSWIMHRVRPSFSGGIRKTLNGHVQM